MAELCYSLDVCVRRFARAVYSCSSARSLTMVLSKDPTDIETGRTHAICALHRRVYVVEKYQVECLLVITPYVLLISSLLVCGCLPACECDCVLVSLNVRGIEFYLLGINVYAYMRRESNDDINLFIVSTGDSGGTSPYYYTFCRLSSTSSISPVLRIHRRSWPMYLLCPVRTCVAL